MKNVIAESSYSQTTLGFSWPVVNAGKSFTHYSHEWYFKIGVIFKSTRPTWFEAAMIYKGIF